MSKISINNQSDTFQSNSPIFWCIYRITNINPNSEHFNWTYIGQHQYKDINNPLGNYFGSGSDLVKDRNLIGKESFKREILIEKLVSKEEADSLEIEYISQEKILNPIGTYNIAKGGYRRSILPDKIKEIGEKISNKKKEWWNSLSPTEYEIICNAIEEKLKEYFRSRTEEEKELWKQKCIEVNNRPEKKQNFIKKMTQWRGKLSEEEKQELIEKRTEGLRKSETREKISNSQKQRYLNETEEEKLERIKRQTKNHSSEKFRQKAKEIKLKSYQDNPGQIEKISRSKKEWYNNLTEEEYKKYCESQKKSEQAIKNISIGRIKWFNNLTEEEYIEYCKSQKKTDGAKKNMSIAAKRRFDNMTNEEKEKFKEKARGSHNSPEYKLFQEKRKKAYYLQKEEALKQNKEPLTWLEFIKIYKIDLESESLQSF